MGRVDEDELLQVLVVLGCRDLDTVAVAAAALGHPDALDVLAARGDVVVGDGRISIQPPAPGPVRTRTDAVERAGLAAGAFLIDADDHEEAGRLALAAALPAVLRSVVRSALRTQPPRVPAPVLRTWRDSGLLTDGDPHTGWLDAACAAAGPEARGEVISRYEATRRAFEDAGDVEAEISVGLAMGILARRADDLGTLIRLVTRAEALVAAGHDEALAPAVLGRVLGHQFRGAPDEALAALDDFPPDRLEGDWSAQVSMIRGANLILLDRADEAIDALGLAVGQGSEWTYAVALELLATARWHAGDTVGAIADLRWAQVVGTRTGASATVHLAAAHATAMEAADGRPEADRATHARDAPVDDEVRRLRAVAEVLGAVAAGNHERAEALARALPQPGRAVRSAAWTIALRAALAGDDEGPGALAQAVPALATALAAGRAGAAHLAGGPPAPAAARASLPATWCRPRPPVVEIHLLGDALVRRDGRAVDHPDWDRTRVRELCLHLALVTDCSRDQVAADLWPDLDPAAAGRNLRVTLTYLTNLLDPDRPPRAPSDMVANRAGLLSFAPTDRLRIDVRSAIEATEALADGVNAGDDVAVVRGARDLLRHPTGSLLGGAVTAPWVEPHDHRRRDATLRAARTGAPRLAHLGHHDLAEALARRGLAEDPWAERLHQVVVRACLARDDLDTARRAMRTALAAMADLEVRPERATVELAEVLGLPTGPRADPAGPAPPR